MSKKRPPRVPGSRGRSGDSHYQDRVVRLHELLPPSGVPIIDGYTFNGCHIVGPAVVKIEATSPGSGSLDSCTFEGDPDAMFIQLAPAQEQVVGVIVLRDCHFEGCRFQNLGFLDKDGEFRTAIGL